MRVMEKGKDFIHGTNFQPSWTTFSEYENKNCSKNYIFDHIVNGINPGEGYVPGSKMNCRRCTFAYELRRRGYVVFARKTALGTGQSNMGLHKVTHNDKIGPISLFSKTVNEVIKMSSGEISELGKEISFSSSTSKSAKKTDI